MATRARRASRTSAMRAARVPSSSTVGIPPADSSSGQAPRQVRRLVGWGSPGSPAGTARRVPITPPPVRLLLEGGSPRCCGPCGSRVARVAGTGRRRGGRSRRPAPPMPPREHHRGGAQEVGGSRRVSMRCASVTCSTGAGASPGSADSPSRLAHRRRAAQLGDGGEQVLVGRQLSWICPAASSALSPGRTWRKVGRPGPQR